jgi:ureidoacrylate peracid hydrolase
MIDLSRIRYAITQLTRAATAILLAISLFAGAKAQSQGLPALAKNLKPSETALILVDFQYPFTNPSGGNYRAVKSELEGKQMLDRTVDLVKKARGMGVWVIHVTEGYSGDYREVDATNPGGFHRGQILRQAWKTGTPETSYYPPLVPGPGDKDLFLPPRIQTSAFGGTGLDQILRSRGIKNIAVAGFTTDVCDYATVTSGYDLGYHVYALKDSMVGYFPDQSELMLKNTYPMWSKVLSNDEFVAMLATDSEVTTR